VKASDKSVDLVARNAGNLERFHYSAKNHQFHFGELKTYRALSGSQTLFAIVRIGHCTLSAHGKHAN
jgi:hypothetical protein